MYARELQTREDEAVSTTDCERPGEEPTDNLRYTRSNQNDLSDSHFLKELEEGAYHA